MKTNNLLEAATPSVVLFNSALKALEARTGLSFTPKGLLIPEAQFLSDSFKKRQKMFNDLTTLTSLVSIVRGKLDALYSSLIINRVLKGKPVLKFLLREYNLLKAMHGILVRNISLIKNVLLRY